MILKLMEFMGLIYEKSIGGPNIWFFSFDY